MRRARSAPASRVISALVLLMAVRANAEPVTAPRIAPLPPEKWSPTVRAALEATLPRVATLNGESTPIAGAKPLPILSVIAHDEALLAPFLGFASALAQHGALPRRDSELLALRTAWRCGSAFEWGHHALYARAAGVSDEEIARVAEEAIASAWSPREAALLHAADELVATQRISDATWAMLRAELTDAQLVEVPFVVGQYAMLSMVAESTGVALEAGLPPLPPTARRDAQPQGKAE